MMTVWKTRHMYTHVTLELFYYQWYGTGRGIPKRLEMIIQ